MVKIKKIIIESKKIAIMSHAKWAVLGIARNSSKQAMLGMHHNGSKWAVPSMTHLGSFFLNKKACGPNGPMGHACHDLPHLGLGPC